MKKFIIMGLLLIEICFNCFSEVVYVRPWIESEYELLWALREDIPDFIPKTLFKAESLQEACEELNISTSDLEFLCSTELDEDLPIKKMTIVWIGYFEGCLIYYFKESNPRESTLTDYFYVKE